MGAAGASPDWGTRGRSPDGRERERARVRARLGRRGLCPPTGAAGVSPDWFKFYRWFLFVATVGS